MAVDTSTEATYSQRQNLKEVKKPVPIQAWYYNPNDGPPASRTSTLPTEKYLPIIFTLGVLTWTQIETKGFENNTFLNKVKSARGYNYEEVLTVTPEKLPNFEENTKKFFMEHLHDHEEIRFILDGVGFEDVRDFDGQWIRIEIKKGDLIVLPPGMYHRFTLDEDQYLKVLLLYQDTPTRIQFEKGLETDALEVRLDYVQSVLELAEKSLEVDDKVLTATTQALAAIAV